MAKTLYHSTLASQGPISALCKSDVLASKFSGKPPYVVLNIAGTDYNYTIENAACQQFWTGKKNQTLTFQASGSRDTATFQFVGQPGSTIPQPPPQQQFAPQAPPQPTQPFVPPPGAPPPQFSPPAAAIAASFAPPAPQAEPAAPQVDVKRIRQTAAQIANLQCIAYAATKYARDHIRAEFGEELSERTFHGLLMNTIIELEGLGMRAHTPVNMQNDK